MKSFLRTGAWICGGIAAILMLLGFIAWMYDGRICGHHWQNYYYPAQNFLLGGILLLFFNHSCCCEKKD